MTAEAWVAWLGVSVVVAGLIFAILRHYGTRRFPALIIGVLSGSATVAIFSLFSTVARPRNATVAIQQPPNGANVIGYRLRIEGVAQPADSLVTLLVRSETDERWWVQEVVYPDPQTGRWMIDGYLGTPAEGARQNFTLIALASDDGPLYRLFTGRWLRRGMSLRTVPLWNRSPLHVVWRTR